MNIIFLTGAPASGKYTIGKLLSERLELSFLHEHQILDLIEIYQIKDERTTKIEQFKHTLMFLQKFFKVYKNNSIVLSMVMSFRNPYYKIFFDKLNQMQGCKIFMIELLVDIQIRLQRNVNEDRLLVKKSKKDTIKSAQKIISLDQFDRLVSNTKDFNRYPNVFHFQIDNNCSDPKSSTEKIYNWIREQDVKLTQ